MKDKNQHHDHNEHHLDQMNHEHHQHHTMKNPAYSNHKDHQAHEMMMHKEHNHKGHDHSAHHAHMIKDFRKRFWISLIVTIPILILSPLIQHFLGFREAFSFAGESYLLFALSSLVFFYGGWPFLRGLFDELKKLQPGMMTLIALAISVAYFYSSAVEICNRYC